MMETKIHCFRVAGLLFEIMLPNICSVEKLLPSFYPFYLEDCERCPSEQSIFRLIAMSLHLEKDSSFTLLKNEFSLLGAECKLSESKEYYLLEIHYGSKGRAHKMKVSRNFAQAQAYIDIESFHASEVLSIFLMFTFAQRGLFYGTFLLHASVIEKNGVGYAFLGKSGTGKSTHTRLWVENIACTTLLNDDNPAVQVCPKTGNILISGTPWSGKTDCYKNRTVRLGALVRLKQEKNNKLMWTEQFEAFLSILPGCSSMRWDNILYSVLCNIVESVVKEVPVALLECQPDKSAAILCYEEIKIKTQKY